MVGAPIELSEHHMRSITSICLSFLATTTLLTAQADDYSGLRMFEAGTLPNLTRLQAAHHVAIRVRATRLPTGVFPASCCRTSTSSLASRLLP